MKKPKPTLQTSIQEAEKHLREEAERIIKAKEIGVSQKSIDKMIALFSISKAYYDDMKRRCEEHGK